MPKSFGYYSSVREERAPWARGQSGTRGGGGDAVGGRGGEGEAGIRYSQQGLGRSDPVAKAASF